MLARTHACVHTHVGRDDRLDVDVQFMEDHQERGSSTSADGGHSEGRCPRRAGQRGVECVLGGGLVRWWGQGRGRGKRSVWRGTDTCVYVLPKGGNGRSVLHYAVLHYADGCGVDAVNATVVTEEEVHTYVCTHKFIHTQIHKYTNIHTCIRAHAHATNTHMHTCTRTDTDMHTYASVWTGWRRWRSCCRSALMPDSKTGYGREHVHVQRGCVHVCTRVAHAYLSL
jgi:hypothetical protein